MNFNNTYIGEIINFYVEHPKYLLLALICSIFFTGGLWILYPDWLKESYYIIGVTSFSGFVLIIAQTMGYWKETKLEKEYDEILKKPFEQKFLIPLKKWMVINYEIQTDEPQRLDKINIKPNTKSTIILTTRIKKDLGIDLEIRDSQYNFGGDEEKKKPKIIKWRNPYYEENTSVVKWFDKELGYDWHDIYHISGKRLIFKDVTYMDGFDIETYDKGVYSFDMNFIVVCKKFKNLEKEKSKEVRTSLTINVV